MTQPDTPAEPGTPAQRKRSRRIQWVALGAGVALLAAVSYIAVPRITTYEVEAQFTSTTGLYVGDDVRIMGVPVGRIESIEPRGDHASVTMSVDRSYDVPADADAILVSPSLVAARFVQLAPAYTGGDTLRGGDSIPLSRTAVPVEWDAIKEQLHRLSMAIGPSERDSAPSEPASGSDANAAPVRPLGGLVDAADANVAGQGETLHDTLAGLSTAMRTLSDGRTDLFGVVRNLQVFVRALAASGQQIVQFNDRMAAVTQVLGANTDQIGSALATLDVAVSDIESFVRDNRDSIAATATDLDAVVGNLVSQREGIEQILHVAPTALSNLDNIYQPAHNAIVSSLAPSNVGNPVDFICSAIAAAEQVGAERGAELCVQYLGPVLRLLTMDYIPLGTNPIRGVGALPDQIVYSGTTPPIRQSPAGVEQLLNPGASR